MAHAISARLAVWTGPAERAPDGVIPWYVWCCVAAAVSAMLGGTWDISWHKTIGRDTFWTPAHMLIYLCGVMTGISCGWLILSTTFQKNSPLRAASVTLWGFRAPLGAFICAWGGIAMLASAPFDDWWHNAYGLDVKVLSPPHVVLILGIIAIRLGALILILASMNRARGAVRSRLDLRSRLEWLALFMGSVLAGGTLSAFLEFTSRNMMHSALFYQIVGIVTPVFLVAVARASKRRFAATAMAAFIMLFTAACLWIFPLFPGRPKLGPVYYQVTHMLPAQDFPLLILAGALAFDLVRRRAGSWSDGTLAAVGGVAFLAAFWAVQWPFADFLNSPASANWFFGTQYVPYFVPPDTDYARGVFTVVEATGTQFWIGMTVAFVGAVLSTRAGLAWGDWMRRLRR
jgi:hypothetical protein